MDFMTLAAHRYSCKSYDGRAVPEEQLQPILEAGRLAPTAKNLQGQRIYVAQSADALRKIDAATPCRYNAATVLVVAYDRNSMFTYPGGKSVSAQEDAAIVATHMLLQAADAGVDSCWVNFFDPEMLGKALGLPENEEIVLLLDLDFAAPGTAPLPNHTKRKPLSETVSYL